MSNIIFKLDDAEFVIPNKDGKLTPEKVYEHMRNAYEELYKFCELINKVGKFDYDLLIHFDIIRRFCNMHSGPRSDVYAKLEEYVLKRNHLIHKYRINYMSAIGFLEEHSLYVDDDDNEALVKLGRFAPDNTDAYYA